MKKKLACLFILTLGITLSGCGSVGGNDVSVSVDEIDFSSFSAEDQKLIELNGTEAKVTTGNDEVDQAINDRLAQETQDFLADADEVLTEAKTFHNEAAADDEWAKQTVFADDLSVRNVYVSGDVLSIIYEHYTYMGGAHGGSERYAYNFDLTDGHVMTWDEINSGDGDALREMMHTHIVNSINGGKYSDYYFFDNYDEDLDRSMKDYNWYIGDGCLNVIYNQYEIAPYAAGIIEFKMSLGNIDNLFYEYKSPATTEGTLSINYTKDADKPNIKLVCGSDETTEDGDTILLTADKAVSNVKIYQVRHAYDFTLYDTGLIGYVNYLPDKASIQLREMLIGTIPNIMVEYEVNGEKERYFVIQSGKDGSLSLVSPEDAGLSVEMQ